MRRAPVLLFLSLSALAACSLFLDSSEFAGGGANDGADASSSEGGSGSDAASDSPTGVDGNSDAGDDFCTRSFADAGHFDPFDSPPPSRWSRVSCNTYAAITKIDGDGQQPPAASFTTDAGLPAETFAICWLEKDLPKGRVYRYGFDVKLVTASTDGNIVVARLGVSGPDGAPVSDYGLMISHGLAQTNVEHRYTFADGGVVFQNERDLAPPTLSWTSYRVELTLGTPSRYRLCRDGLLISEKALDHPLDPSPVDPVLEIGLIYTSHPQPPLELRFDNAFAEVVP